ncbi:response regulator [Fulvivirga sediminis]|uniref:Response regulator n=1 Tax=Fulvivirga sediminis TaxID=2803949 RepID=A0A937FAJ2_9BACT|nr:response regulator [Fulvivirga sediminis]MBL3658336.1 response regulator [Fulvivirga sediminis]
MKLNAFEKFKNMRVLVLEDSPEDAELMLDELEKTGLIIEAIVTMTRADFKHNLINFSPDIILADYSLPEITGIEALSISSEEYPDIPFIFVTGTIGEEIAAETILNGASGLVLKSNLHKLPDVLMDVLHKKGRWYSKRLEWVSKRIHLRIEKNIEALNRIEEFMQAQNPPQDISNDLNTALSDLRQLREDFIKEDDNSLGLN